MHPVVRILLSRSVQLRTLLNKVGMIWLSKIVNKYFWVKWCKHGWNWSTVWTERQHFYKELRKNCKMIIIGVSLSISYFRLVRIGLKYVCSFTFWNRICRWITYIRKVEYNEFHFYLSIFGEWVVFESLEIRLIIGKY